MSFKDFLGYYKKPEADRKSGSEELIIDSARLDLYDSPKKFDEYAYAAQNSDNENTQKFKELEDFIKNTMGYKKIDIAFKNPKKKTVGYTSVSADGEEVFIKTVFLSDNCNRDFLGKQGLNKGTLDEQWDSFLNDVKNEGIVERRKATVERFFREFTVHKELSKKEWVPELKYVSALQRIRNGRLNDVICVAVFKKFETAKEHFDKCPNEELLSEGLRFFEDAIAILRELAPYDVIDVKFDNFLYDNSIAPPRLLITDFGGVKRSENPTITSLSYTPGYFPKFEEKKTNRDISKLHENIDKLNVYALCVSFVVDILGCSSDRDDSKSAIDFEELHRRLSTREELFKVIKKALEAQDYPEIAGFDEMEAVLKKEPSPVPPPKPTPTPKPTPPSPEEVYRESIRLKDKGDPRAIAKLKEAADMKYIKAQLVYGSMLFNGEVVEKDEAKGLEYLKEAADTGDATAKAKYANALVRTDSEEKCALGVEIVNELVQAGNEYGLLLRDELIKNGIITQ